MSRRTKSYRPTEPGTPQNRLKPLEKFRPLDPGKPLAPYRVPSLKVFDRQMPGQGMLDFDQDGPAIVYPEDQATEES